jgi:inner membrane protein CreD
MATSEVREALEVTPVKLFAVFLILVCASVAWVVLGTANVMRTDDKSSTLVRQVGDLWGEQQVQEAPVFARQAEAARAGAKPGAGALEVAGTDIEATFDLQPRRKGLLWYATYAVDLKAAYRVANPDARTIGATMTLRFPTANGVYDGFAVNVDGKDVPVTVRDGRAVAAFQMAPRSTATIKTGYVTQGLNEWRYQPTTGAVGVIRDLKVVMRTNFTQVDYPVDAVSPSKAETVDGGMVLTWAYSSLVSGRPIALVMPKPTNPGPLASRISYFAPVSLLFFFAALVLLTSTSTVRLHPMHYGFLAAAFFAFQLLFSYLVDRVDLNLSFAIAAIASVALVVGYLSAVVGRNRVLLEIAASQFVFLVLFSYSFFFEGLTGLAIAIGSVVTLAYFMARTARVDWDAMFRRKRGEAQAGGYPPPAPSQAAAPGFPAPPSA